MKISSVFGLLIFLFGCSSSSGFDNKLLKRSTGGVPNGIILSCIRCSCMVEALKQNNKTLKGIRIFGSKNCISPKDSIEFTNLPQETLDSVYEKNFNIILFKANSEKKYKFRLVKTEEVVNFTGIIKSFFEQ